MEKGVENLILNAGNLKKDEKLLILFDNTTKNIAENFAYIAKKYTDNIFLEKVKSSNIHGKEPGEKIKQKMLNADLIICLTKNSLAHNDARIKANERGVRFLSLPDYNIDILKNEAVLVNFKKHIKNTEKITELLTLGKNIKIITTNGTCLYANIENRFGNCCPGYTNEKYLLGSPPDIEANIAPIENKTTGVIIADGSITDCRIGLLRDKVRLDIKNGLITNIQSENLKHVDLLNKIFDNDKKRILAEIGIGLNKKAKICGNMLIDEGCYGAIHFGFGSNITIGGDNNVNFHLDFVIKKPTLQIDAQTIIKEGVFSDSKL